MEASFFLEDELEERRDVEALAAPDNEEVGRESGGIDESAPYFLGRPRFRFADSAAAVAMAEGRACEGRGLTVWGIENGFASPVEEDRAEKIPFPEIGEEAVPSTSWWLWWWWWWWWSLK